MSVRRRPLRLTDGCERSVFRYLFYASPTRLNTTIPSVENWEISADYTDYADFVSDTLRAVVGPSKAPICSKLFAPKLIKRPLSCLRAKRDPTISAQFGEEFSNHEWTPIDTNRSVQFVSIRGFFLIVCGCGCVICGYFPILYARDCGI